VDGQLGTVVVEVVGDRSQQVGLSQPGWAVKEEGVVGLPGGLGYRQGGGVGKAVAGTDDEALEGVGGIDRDAGGQLRRALGGRVPRGLLGGDQLELTQSGASFSEGRSEQLGVALADPAQDVLGAGEEENRSPARDRAQRLEPELVGRL